MCCEKNHWDIEEHLRQSLKCLTVISMSPDAVKWQIMFTVFPSEANMTVHTISPAPQ